MKIRRFFAPDMRRAIQLVRTEHGADAVILSSRAVDGGMEIVSAVDYDEELIAQMIQPGVRARTGMSDEPRPEGMDEAAAREQEDAATHAPEKAVASTQEGAGAGAQGDLLDHADAAPSDQRAPLRRTRAGQANRRRTRPADGPAERLPAAVAAERTAAVIRADRTAGEADRGAAAEGEALGWPAALEAALPRMTNPEPQTVEAPREDPSIAALRNELLAMRSMLCRQLSQLKSADRRMLEPERALLATRVASLGLDDELAETLVTEIEDPGNERAWREVMYGLARRLDVPKEDPLEHGGVFALVGPTGVGKTTTIAKLAARHCLRYGRESLALISTDTLRIGAQRQLDAYGAILGVPVRQASGAAELVRLLGALADRRLVLIDTAGLSSRDRRLAAALSQLEADRRVQRLVVLPATMQPAVMHEAVTAFGGDALAGAVLTKLDETDSLGAALSVLIRRKLKAMWLSHGQRVPEDLKLARIIHLLRWALDEPRFTAPHDGTEAPWNTAAAEVMHAGV